MNCGCKVWLWGPFDVVSTLLPPAPLKMLPMPPELPPTDF